MKLDKFVKFVRKGWFGEREKKKETYTYKQCHCGTVEVFTDPVSKVKIKAGGSMRQVEVSPEDLLIDCGANFFSSSFPEVKKYNNSIIILNIPNGSVPKLNIKFWEDLVKVIRKEKKDVLISCVGGHGRTGTCLSVLAFLMIPKAKENPIKYVRDCYCQKAVENSIQFNYVKNLLNLNIEEPEFHTTSYHGLIY